MPWPQDPPDQQNPYAVLGVDRDASTAEIIRAFRVLARGYHPDLHPDDDDAVRRFRDLATAYQLLADPTRRATWDQAHPVRPPQPTPPKAAQVMPTAVRAGPRHSAPPLRASPVYHTPPTR